MSRHTVKHPTLNQELSYGLDHMLGWFLTVYDYELEDEDDNIILEKSTMFDNLNQEDMVLKMKEFNAPQEHIDRVLFDLDIE